MEKVDITVIGAGIIGLAISASLATDKKTIYTLERNRAFGQESSSRNSEVIHAGIYYPQQSLKTKTCVRGNQLIYALCKKENIPCKKLGKLIVACDREEIKQLEHLLQNGQANGVPGLRILDQSQLGQLEPHVRAQAGLYSPSTGIVDSHSLMQYFFQKAKAQGAEFVFQTEAVAINPEKDGFKIRVCDSQQSDFSFVSRVIINCAGLNSDRIAELAGLDIQKQHYRLRYCKGEYFRLHSSKSSLVQHLIYPVPDQKEVSLGIHATPDLAGGLRLGPDAEYLCREEANYNVDESKKQQFQQAVHRFLPFVEAQDLQPDTAGFRPKLQGPENGFRDFVICHEAERGFPGLINLIGIDSPGLTAAPAIAQYVQQIVEQII